MTEKQIQKRIQVLETALADVCRLLQVGKISDLERQHLTNEGNLLTAKIEELRRVA